MTGSDDFRWESSGLVIVASSNTMKPRTKRILAAIFWLAIITTIILNGLWEQSLWIGGAN